MEHTLRTKHQRAVLTVTVLLAATLAANAADAGGKWMADIDTPMGVQKTTFDIKVADGKVTGSSSSEMTGSLEIKDGKIDGDNISFTQVADFGGMTIKFSYKGVVSGDEIKFNRVIEGFGTENFTAKRSQ